MTHKFPVFAAHDVVDCHGCHADLGAEPEKAAGYPPGRGAWKKDCPKCGLGTWYDLKKEKVT